MSRENNPTKRQHWVPQFYLSKFAADDEKLSALNLKRKSLQTNRYMPKSICCGEFFYAYETGIFDQISQAYEEAFKIMEDDFSNFYDDFCNKILKGGYDEKLLQKVALHISALWLRTPKIRKQLKDMEEKMKKDIGAWRAADKDWFYESARNALDSKVSDEEIEWARQMLLNKTYGLEIKDNSGHLDLMQEQGVKGFANLFYEKKWSILYIPANRPWSFITSDVPVIEVFPERMGIYGATFAQRTHYFALTPKIVIEFSNWNGAGKPRKRRMIRSEEEVDRLNYLRLNHSFGFAYSGENAGLNFAVRYLENRKKAYSRKLSHLIALSGLGKV